MKILKKIGSLLWKMWYDLITDDLISFYVFFTTIFAEVAYLFAFKGISIAVIGTIILFAYIANILICGYIQGENEGYRQELYAAIAYDVICIAIFIIGCLINLKLNIIITLIPIIATAIAIYIRNFNGMYLCKFKGINKIVNRIIKSHVAYVISQILVIGGPFIAFVVMFAMIPQISLIFKVIIPILYFIVMPLFAELEDNLATKSIFELAYDITYDGDESYFEVHERGKE